MPGAVRIAHKVWCWFGDIRQTLSPSIRLQMLEKDSQFLQSHWFSLTFYDIAGRWFGNNQYSHFHLNLNVICFSWKWCYKSKSHTNKCKQLSNATVSPKIIAINVSFNIHCIINPLMSTLLPNGYLVQFHFDYCWIFCAPKCLAKRMRIVCRLASLSNYWIFNNLHFKFKILN